MKYRATVSRFKQPGVTCLLVAGLKLARIATVMTLFFVSPEMRALCSGGTASIQQFPLAELAMGGLVFMIAWVMDAGRGLREETELAI